MHASLIGWTLGDRIAITGQLGAGGSAVVYRGVIVGEDREVAVKVLDPSHAADDEVVRRFRREARASARLDHPNVVKILEQGVDGAFVYLVMELVEGRDLFETLRQDRRLPEARAAAIMAEVCAALGAAHAQGIVHRDLKPENVMLLRCAAGSPERVKVLDFGIAKMLDRQRPAGRDAAGGRRAEDESPSGARSAITKAGVALGTPHYLAPEVGRAEPVDHRADLYACGVVLYQLVTGQLPFDGDTPLQILRKHVHDSPRAPSEIIPSISPRLEALILKALAKQPADRHQTAGELERALRSLLPELRMERQDSLRPPASGGLGLGAAILSAPVLELALDTPSAWASGPTDRDAAVRADAERKSPTSSAPTASTQQEDRPSRALERFGLDTPGDGLEMGAPIASDRPDVAPPASHASAASRAAARDGNHPTWRSREAEVPVSGPPSASSRAPAPVVVTPTPPRGLELGIALALALSVGVILLVLLSR
jgi:eukaryotic-like serine/threonine-protein kinase